MENNIERPASLTPTLSTTIFGNALSKVLVQKSYDEAFKGYGELINDGWTHESALRSAYMTLIGTLESKIHTLAEGGES
jgi:hypothetical protein